MNNFLLRLLTGAIYVILITAGIIINSYSFLALFSIVAVFCLWEFSSLINRIKNAGINPYVSCFGGILLFACTYLIASGTFSYLVLFAYLFYIMTILVSELYLKKPDPLAHTAFTLMGQCYIALPLSMLNVIAFQPGLSGGIQYFPILVFALFVFIWVNDTGAYLVGVKFGKHRLFERISPKKSWEGFFGGLIFTALASLAFAHYEPIIPYYHWIGIAISVVVFGTWGDLIESLMKRTLGVKDSGNSLPGHGGFLDRFDSLLLAVYGMLFYILLFIRN